MVTTELIRHIYIYVYIYVKSALKMMHVCVCMCTRHVIYVWTHTQNTLVL